MSAHWSTQRERGSVLAMKLITWIAFTFGRRVSRALLYPVCLYYMLAVRRSTRASRQYLARALGRHPGWRDVFRHYYSFAACCSTARSCWLAGRLRWTSTVRTSTWCGGWSPSAAVACCSARILAAST